MNDANLGPRAAQAAAFCTPRTCWVSLALQLCLMWSSWILEPCVCIGVFSASYLLFCCEKASPKRQWGPVSPEQVNTTLCWKRRRKEASKRLFEALLEQVIGRSLCPAGFPGYQQERSLSVPKNKGNPQGVQRVAVTCVSELREKYPTAQVENWLHVAKFHHQILQQREKGVNGSRICPQTLPQGTARISDRFLFPPIVV